VRGWLRAEQTVLKEAAMITHEQNAFLTLTSPGSVMGALFRRYWIPALLSDELPQPNCPPVRHS